MAKAAEAGALAQFSAGMKLAGVIFWIALCYGPVWAAKKLGYYRQRDTLVRLCYRGLLRICGVKLAMVGQPSPRRPLLLVTNHLSYFDIMILGAAAPVRFTPKSEISGWPVIGSICRVCDAIFIDRRLEKTAEMKSRLQAALARGEMLCLFPEATTGNGRHLQPFKSSLFSLAEEKIAGESIELQPAAIVYRRIRRLPIDSAQWPQLAWYGDMNLLPHLWNALMLGPIEAEIIFLPPVSAQAGDRKQLAAHCHRAIAEAMER